MARCGCRQIRWPSRYCRVRAARDDGASFDQRRQAWSFLKGGGARRDRGYYWTHVGADLDGLFEKYRRAGAEIVSPPEDRPWGLRDFRLRDPDGHLHCFAAEIGTK